MDTPIILSRLDVERIESLLDTPTLRDSPATEKLRAEFDRAEIVEPAAMPHAVVSMNSSADCADESNGKHYTLTLVYPKDADADRGRFRCWPGRQRVAGPARGPEHQLARPGRSDTPPQGHCDPLPA